MTTSPARGHAVVTGGASGIGAAVVNRLLARGLRVTSLDLAEGDSGVRQVRVDCTDERAVGEALDEAWEAAGPVTSVVTCHGVRGQYVPALETDADRMRHVLDVHVMGTFLVVRAAARRLQAADLAGSMVTISSTTAYRGWANQVDYGVAKAAVRQLTENLAVEWAPLGIRVNCVAPGFTRTPMVAQMIDEGYDIAPVLARTPLGRLAEADDIAGSVEHLLLDAGYTTGVCVAVDGGWTAVGK